MPLTGKAKAEYQRKLMRDRRSGEAGPGRTDIAKAAALADVPPGHEHYWLRRAGDEHAVCVRFEMQGRIIGGCGEKREYKGKLVPSFDDHPELAVVIIDSDHYKEIQAAMPVTKTRG